eukprot:CAMPEP_0119477704 /NCGR_PEP_ID=MMETSP1344-20130328/7756_1 /TAXON_ID=236787 /ORGANISM="Florenciella parvula, Strain CCMP2471" /LENGTH=449 /DNA_ID=CAMNT_0007511777 /DNA_START=154 /DNA_END=1503 /DNA_ORIENTATION=+
MARLLSATAGMLASFLFVSSSPVCLALVPSPAAVRPASGARSAGVLPRTHAKSPGNLASGGAGWGGGSSRWSTGLLGGPGLVPGLGGSSSRATRGAPLSMVGTWEYRGNGAHLPTPEDIGEDSDGDVASEQNFYEAPAFVRHFDMRHFQDKIHEFKDANDIPLAMFSRIRNEAANVVRSALVGPSISQYILERKTLGDALAAILAPKLANANMPEDRVEKLLREAYERHPSLVQKACADLSEITRKDPAVSSSLLQPFLFFKGFHATQVQRIAHCLWKRGDFESRTTALALQSRMSEIWAVDMHPGAIIHAGLFLDHAHGVVIGETAVIGERTTMLHGVTLGGTGKGNSGERRHPIIGDDCVIGAGSTILGNIKIGDRCVIGAQAVITIPVADDRTAVGLNRILEPEKKAEGVPFQADEALSEISPDLPHPAEQLEAPKSMPDDDWVMI